jgi:alpha-ketoglutarate-dependent taurine dioxygenase
MDGVQTARPGEESSGTLRIKPMSVFTGAEIDGADLKQPLTAEVVDELWAAVRKWKVIFLRGQHLDHDQHLAFAKQLGVPTMGHVMYGSVEGRPEMFWVGNVWKGDTKKVLDGIHWRSWATWHSDLMPALNPPSLSILRSVITPPYGGDTKWTNLAAAYDALSDTMKDMIGGLRALNRYGDRERTVKRTTELPTLTTEHPVVRVHPETGERVLYVTPSFTESIVGLSSRESEVMLEFLWEHLVREEWTCRYRWEEGDVAIWDNRASAHRAPADVGFTEFDRELYRISLMGEIPVGIDGRPSTSIEGAPLAAAPKRAA